VSFLNLENKTFVVFGVANKKSVAFHIGQALSEAKANVIYSVRSNERRESLAQRLPEASIHVCDVEHDGAIQKLSESVAGQVDGIDGIVHSIAFANYEKGMKPFHETSKKDFLQAIQVSCHSLIEIAECFKDQLRPNASVITISISTTTMAAENYGYMAPIKAALDSTVVFLAKSFSSFSKIRFNAVCAGLLKTSASAGIPGYVESYLFAEQAILRKEALKTQEVADAAVFLLSERSSGINAQRIVVDAGMGVNYFDRNLVSQAMKT
jgi:enoyl-[acyl-carrier protein] reductase I